MDKVGEWLMILHYNFAVHHLFREVFSSIRPAASDLAYTREGVDMIAPKDALMSCSDAQRVLSSILDSGQVPPGFSTRPYRPGPAG